MAKHLVLGSHGLIGGYVVKDLSDRGETVYQWDAEMGEVCNYDYDLRSENATVKLLAPVMEQADFVHFLAFDYPLTGHSYSFRSIDNNMLIMHNVFQLLQALKKPFYYASSGTSSADSAYGRLKAIGESYAHSLGGLVVRFWDVYGDDSSCERTNLVTDLIRMALRDKTILVKTDGLEVRNFLYGPDAARMLCAIPKNYDLLKSILEGEVDIAYKFPDKSIPIANNQWVSIRELAGIIASCVGDTQIFYSAERDQSEGPMNKVPRGLNTIREMAGMPQLAMGFTTLYASIQELIEKLKEEL